MKLTEHIAYFGIQYSSYCLKSSWRVNSDLTTAVVSIQNTTNNSFSCMLKHISVGGSRPKHMIKSILQVLKAMAGYAPWLGLYSSWHNLNLWVKDQHVVTDGMSNSPIFLTVLLLIGRAKANNHLKQSSKL